MEDNYAEESELELAEETVENYISDLLRISYNFAIRPALLIEYFE